MNLQTLKSVLCFCLFVFAFSFGEAANAQEDISPDQLKFFETKIRPVLIKECYSCHSKSGNTKGSLLVDSRQALLNGGDSGPAIVPGDLDESMLWSAINYEDFAMPPRNPLSDEEIADFRKWIEMGAPDPRVMKISEVNSTVSDEDIARGKEFWSYKQPAAPKVPRSMKSDWPKTEIDQFVAVKMENANVQPNEDADAHTLLRRLCFDLNGLPPTPEQISWFQREWKKNPDDAIEHVVDSLLAKPQFGERWGRHWLDVARFGESTGKEYNATFPHAWRYRDYVIDSFNEDKPYDRFVQEQIAGDLLPVKTDEQWQENLIATGFLAVGSKTLAEQNRLKFRMDVIDEQIDATTRVMLGVSVACARCHDHKFDPIPQSDYYALAGIFQSTNTFYGTVDGQQNRNPSGLIELPIEDASDFDKTMSNSEITATKKQIEEKQEEMVEARRVRVMTMRGGNSDSTDSKSQVDVQRSIRQALRLGNEISALEHKLTSVDENGKPLSFCMGAQPAEQPRNARLLVGGEVDQAAQEIPRGFVQVLDHSNKQIASDSTGRLELARWLTSRDNPLAARVMVNRIWQHLLGEGIVRSSDDFGITGIKPTHPELLDHLAVQFMENDWSVKSMIKQIVTSRVYHVSATYDDAKFTTDPENKLFWRANPRRLEGEVIRDAMLAVAGEIELDRPRGSLVAKGGAMRYTGVGGAFSRAMMMADGKGRMNNDMMQRMRRGRDAPTSDQVREMIQKRARERAKRAGVDTDFDSGPFVLNEITVNAPEKHRSIYLPVLRDGMPRSLSLFDMPEPSMIVGKRESSDTATQALYMMNNDFVLEVSDSLAKRIAKEEQDVRKQVALAFLLAYGREASSDELQIAAEFLQSYASDPASRNRHSQSDAKLEAMTSLCQAILASAEFRYLN